MTFQNNELSAYGGKPIQLYEFLRSSGGTNFYWRYNGSDRGLTYAGAFYKAVPISDQGSRFSLDAQSTDLIVTMPVAEDFCQVFRSGGVVSSDSIYLTVRRVHANDIADIDTTPVVGDALVVWVGTVSGISQTDELAAKVTCAMLSASFRRGGLRYGYQRSCPHVLYSQTLYTCLVDKDAFRVDATVTAISGLVVSAVEFDVPISGDFAGGFIEYTTPEGFIERRFVTDHVTTDVTLMTPPVGLAVGDEVAIFPGCDRTTTRCKNKFDNLLNHGGFPSMPGRNPFDGMPVF